MMEEIFYLLLLCVRAIMSGLSEYPTNFYPKPGVHVCGYRLIPKSDCTTGDLHVNNVNQRGQYDMSYCASLCDSLSICPNCDGNTKCQNFMVGFVTSQTTTCWPKSVACDSGHNSYRVHNTLYQYAREIPPGIKYNAYNLTVPETNLTDGSIDTCLTEGINSKWTVMSAEGPTPGTTVQIRVQLYIPGVTNTECHAFDGVFYELQNVSCNQVRRCTTLGKSASAEACDYRCPCENRNCSIGVFPAESHKNMGLNGICELCVFDNY